MSKRVEHLVIEQLVGEGDEVAATEAGTTRVDQQRAHSRVRVVRETSHDVDPEHAPFRVGVVDRHLEIALLDTWPDLRPHDLLGLPRLFLALLTGAAIEVSGTVVSPVSTASALAA